MSGLSKMAALREAAARMNAEHDQDDAYDSLASYAGPPLPRAIKPEREQAAPAAAAPQTTEPATVAEAPSAPTATPDRTAGKATSSNGDRVHTSIYLPRDIRRRLREIAAAEECKVHDLIMEGVNAVVARRSARRTPPP